MTFPWTTDLIKQPEFEQTEHSELSKYRHLYTDILAFEVSIPGPILCT